MAGHIANYSIELFVIISNEIIIITAGFITVQAPGSNIQTVYSRTLSRQKGLLNFLCQVKSATQPVALN